MPSPRRLAHAIRHRGLPWNARAGLLRMQLARRVRRRPVYGLRFGKWRVFLSDDDYDIDWASLAFVVVDDAYAGDYEGATVVDIGAHKGYYGAYALAHGARAVVSYEPETANFALLERAAADARRRGGVWHTTRSAVGAERGEAALHVMGASWGHALHPPEAFRRYEIGSECVRVEALADVLVAAVGLAAGARVIVKINIEGEECPTILGTATSAWNRVDEVYVETHPWAACEADDLARYLERAELTTAASGHGAVLRLQRGVAAAAPRTDPT